MWRPALLVVLAVLAITPPVEAKGPTAVEVDGPGVRLMLSYDDPGVERDLWRLGRATNVWELYREHPRLGGAPALSAAELGQRYVATWRQADTVLFVQHLYPFAEGGPWVEVPSGQPVRYDGRQIGPGWTRGSERLGAILGRLGVEEPWEPSTAIVPTPTREPLRSAPDDQAVWPYLTLALGGVGVAVAVAVAGSLVLRRRSP